MKRILRVFEIALASSLFSISIPLSDAAIVVARDSPGWKYFKGTEEASIPTGAWRTQGFDDSAWSTGDTPFRYGDGSGGTVLNDMRNNYSTVFMRRAFNVADVALISRLTMNVDYDDGFTVWINGNEVLEENAPGNPTFDSFAGTNHESGSFESFELSNPAGYLVDGENTIAIQVFNVSLGSSDIMMNPELVSTAPDFEPPVVLSFDPAPGTVLNLSQITVNFSEPVTGVSAADLEINDTGAQSVSGSGDQYTFTFTNVPLGQTTVTWALNHGIADTAVVPNAFDHTALGEVRVYNVVDNLPPTVTGIFPPAGVTLRNFGELEVTFSESVSGVDATDLLANGISASSVSGSGTGPYTFNFEGVGAGPLAVTWAAGHGIQDFAAEPNPFQPNSWDYTVDPDAAFGDLVINELIASNRSGLLDGDGEASDWIELHNFGGNAIELAGWSLSDDAAEPGKFVLPARSLPAGGYLVIFATGKDRAPAGFGEIHTNFKLSGSGEYIGLSSPESPRTVADEISPGYPQQRNDHSYGRDSSGTWRYYATPTPGRANGDSTIIGLLEKPHTNVERGFYNTPFDLHLTSPDDGATLRYTTDGSEPTSSNGKIYGGPIAITRTTVFRAAAFKTGYLPSEINTQTFLYDASAAIRSLPVVSLTTDDSNLWGPTGIQETNPRNCAERGIAWERPVSAEIIDANDPGRNLGVNCGLRVQGGNYIRGNYNPNGGLPFSKYSFRLYFRGDYGPTTLKYPFFQGHAVQEFDRVTLRAGMNDHSNPFIVDEMIRRMQFDTGNVAARGNFVNLFINGDYKRYYNPTERIDDDFMRSWHGGEGAWDVIAQFGEVREGDNTEWNRMRSIVGRDQSVPANYAASLEVLDVDNFIDYLLVNIYGGTGDWPGNNWRAARERVAGARFRFYVWDAEWSLGNQGRSVNTNTITGELGGGSEIARLFQSLTSSPEFRLRFADRVHKHFFNGGALEDARISDHYEGMRGELSRVLSNMSTSIRNTWIPRRRGIIMQHLSDADLQHSDDAPVFNQFGGSVPSGFELSMTAPGGTIYYTLDGTDPRAPIVDDGGGSSTEILAEGAAKRVLVPSVANGGSTIGTTWTGGNEPFDDSSWTAGTGGVGYDEANTYDNLIDIDVDAEMNEINGSCYIRIPFTVTADDLTDANLMQLKARYDDGFIAYLNGVRIVSANGPAAPRWNSTAEGNNSDESAVNLRAFNASKFMDELLVGNNLLAIHGLNTGLTSSDFLASFSMEVGENFAGEVSETAIEYTGAPAIEGTTLVKARTLRNGVWSALTEATFINGPATPQLRFTEIMFNPPGGSAHEFLEIQNVGPLPVDLGFVCLDGVNFTFPGETLIAPGEILVLASNDAPSTFAAAYPGVVVFDYFGGSLSNGGERVALRDAFGNTLVSVDYSDGGGWPATADGGNRSLVLVDVDGDPDDPANWVASTSEGGSPGASEPAPARPVVIINEVLADGADFVELRNTGGTSVELGGWGFSDDGGNPMRFAFPPGTQIEPGQFLVVWCDSEAGDGLHSGFGLDREGESLFLTDAAGARVDAFSFGLQVTGLSLSNDAGGWALAAPTAGTTNGAPLELATQSQLSVNEWLANPLPGGDDWLEIYNNDPTKPVSLHGLHIGNGDATFRYSARSFLAPGAVVRLWADNGVGADHLDLRLPAEGGALTLGAVDGREIESLTFGQQTEGVSSGRLPDGAASITTFPTSASPGTPNYAAASSPIVLNELLAGTGGWIELKNTGGTSMALNGFTLAVNDRESAAVPLPPGSSIPAGGRAHIELATSRESGAIFLFDTGGREIDRLEYGAQPNGMSIGRPSDSGSFTLLSSPTPGGLNSDAQSLSSTSALRINEWLANADTDGSDYIELYNPGNNPVSLAGLRLTDDLSQTGIDQFTFPPLSYIGSAGFLALTADNSRSFGHLPFNLDSDGETLRLYRASGTTIIDEVTWGIESEGIASGRTTNGGPTIASLAFKSPGASNELDPNADSDGDGIPDWWEIANGLSPNDLSDATLDGDADTGTNLFEYFSGTDPNDPASLLRFESLTIDLTGLTMQFTARAGIRYLIEFSDDLANGNWAVLANIPSSATDRTEAVLDIGIGGATERYYRIVADRP